MILDWNGIRALDGRQDKGFEELCAQLARAERPSGSEFVRKGTPDAGVECYAILSDDSEWAWQSKYFNRLGDSQWSQIDESVKTALAKHPKLVRYFVCVPLDRPDARREGQKSAKERWDERVAKWSEWAAELNMSVKFIYWGSHELLEFLAQSRHVGRVQFWFDVQGFDTPWFRVRLDEALGTAGPRYTPEHRVELPIAQKFEAFGRTSRFFDRQKAFAQTIRKELEALVYPEDVDDPTVVAEWAAVLSKVQAVLNAIDDIDVQAAGPLPFRDISEKVRDSEEAAKEFSQLLDERKRQLEAKAESNDTEAHGSFYRRHPFLGRSDPLGPLMSELSKVQESFVHADKIADSPLIILRGRAGTGKTHLLCEVAQQRISEGRPTVLLMGQRFMSNETPWHQALQQLDLSNLSAEKFVGALEAAAQVAGSRALLMIDAINEGAGRNIWPNHLAAFLAPLEKSLWIGVVLAVRSSFEELIIPEDVRSRVPMVPHKGFSGHEYDAAKTFFAYYKLELPSTPLPLLASEFQNPLFLKLLCQGLHANSKRRLPRGFQGITDVFDLYFTAVNERLASKLDFNPRTQLVRQALEAVADVMLDSGNSWLTSAKAEEVINRLLPGRGFAQSLYRGLVTEDVLVENVHNVTEEVIISVAYERFTDHLMASSLLSKYLDIKNPASAFAATGKLAFVCDNNHRVLPGLLEALCIQIPEKIRQELSSVAPACSNRAEFGDAFRQSLIWRSHTAFSKDTEQVLNKLLFRSRDDLHATLDALLTVATLPEHSLNARFLDQLFRKGTMPDRDAWWSVYLHHAYSKPGPINTLVDWASSMNPRTMVDDEAIDLCAIVLSWMFSTSNRFLRDRATMALVSLLTGRLAATVRLVGRFADVDDPYVTERIYAVAYGVAMRSHNPVEVGTLAMCVYEKVFASQSPPPHILLRDYGRGVVERALYLGSNIDVIPDHIRPPYNSTWPTIPTEEDINTLKSNWSNESYDTDELKWGRDRIVRSVMDDDFALYVIGTISSRTDWLSLRLEEPQWKPQLRIDDLSRRPTELELSLCYPPGFELHKIQRYVLWRVFDLGWTIKRFGHFDRFSIENYGRDASKPERIGKKYQWIAYHEIMALISDHFQYRLKEDDDQVYNGPWQGSFRDIDPSCTLKSVSGETSLENHSDSWWVPAQYDSWGDLDKPLNWITDTNNLPKIENLLVVTNRADGSRWINCQGLFRWRRQLPVDRESSDVETRKLRYDFTSYLVREDDVKAYLQWAKGINLAGRDMQTHAITVDRMLDVPTVYVMFLGEHAWAPASHYFQQPYYGDDGCPVKLRAVTCKYCREPGGFDCSIAKYQTISLPSADLVRDLGIRWSGHGADFTDDADRLVAQDPTVRSEGPSAMLFREDFLQEFLIREKLVICWAVRAEKCLISPVYPFDLELQLFGGYRYMGISKNQASLPTGGSVAMKAPVAARDRTGKQDFSDEGEATFRGAHTLAEGCVMGSLNHRIDEPIAEDDPVVSLMSTASTSRASRYCLSFTAASLRPELAAVIAQIYLKTQIYLKKGDWRKTKAVVLEYNALQAPSPSTAKRLESELRQRLQTLTPAQLGLLATGSSDDRTAMAWLAVLKRVRLAFDVVQNVLAEKLAGMDPVLRRSDMEAFYEQQERSHPKLARLTETSQQKIRSTLLHMLRDGGLLAGKAGKDGSLGTVQRPLLSPEALQLVSADHPLWLRGFLVD